MKRLRRWLFNFAAAVSLMLCVLVVIDRCGHARRTNVLSYFLVHGGNGPSVLHAYSINTGGGIVVFAFDRREGTAAKMMGSGFSWVSLPFPDDSMTTDASLVARAGFTASSLTKSRHIDRDSWVSAGYSATAPSWFLAFLFALLPVLRILRWRQRRKPLLGACPNCGYDLRATPERCPECGAIPTAAAKTIP